MGGQRPEGRGQADKPDTTGPIRRAIRAETEGKLTGRQIEDILTDEDSVAALTRARRFNNGIFPLKYAQTGRDHRGGAQMLSEKVIGPTPMGGDYSVLICLDEKGDPVKKNQAVQARILEYKNDGTLVATTYLRRAKKDRDGTQKMDSTRQTI